MPEEIVWEDPPNNRVTSLVFEETLAKVKERRGEWARIRTFDTQGVAHGARKRLISKETKADPCWEFKVARLNNNGARYGLYARYCTEDQMAEILAKKKR